MADLTASGYTPGVIWDCTDPTNNIDWKMVVDGKLSVYQNAFGAGYTKRQEWSADTLSIQNSGGSTLELQDGSDNGFQLEYDTTDGLLIQEVGGSDPLVSIDDTTASFATDIVLEGSTTNATLSNNGSSLDMAVGSSVLEVSASKIQCKQDLEMASGEKVTSASGANLELAAAAGQDLLLTTSSFGKVRLQSNGNLDLESAANTLVKGGDVIAEIGTVAGSDFVVRSGAATTVMDVGQDHVATLYDPGATASITLDPEQATSAAQVVIGHTARTKRGLLSLESYHDVSGDKAGVLSFKADDGQEVCLSVWKYVNGSDTYFRLWLTKGSAPASAPTSEDAAHKILGYVE